MSKDIKADERESINLFKIQGSFLKVTFLLATPPRLRRLCQTEENKLNLSPFDPPFVPPKGSDPVWAFELAVVRGSVAS